MRAGALLVGNNSEVRRLQMARDLGVGHKASAFDIGVRNTSPSPREKVLQRAGFLPHKAKNGLRQFANDVFKGGEGNVAQVVVVQGTVHHDDRWTIARPGRRSAERE